MSHSQYNEDTIIAEFFGADFKGNFLDIGAADGERNSNTRALALRGWSGVLVEPLPFAFNALLKLYGAEANKVLINAAISSHGKPVVFHTGRESQLSTANMATVNLPNMRPWFTSSFWTPTLTPADLLSIIGDKPLDFVTLDCEGLDLSIARHCADLLKSTRLFCYETDEPGTAPSASYAAQWAEVLATLGFTKVIGKTNGNTLVTRP
jgi:FkbM family methyltransferase